MKFTRFEMARIIGARALQISMGAPPLLGTKESTDPFVLASLEFEDGVLTITVIRS